MSRNIRNTSGLTLPFALILTFIFSALVSVAYLFVSINLSQMQSSLLTSQAIALAEGINERIKARLNTKTKIEPSPEQEKKIKSNLLQSKTKDEEGEGDEEALAEEQFNEETEDFDEYYADEVLKIARYITFREPPKGEEGSPNLQIEANVEMIGDIEIPRGTILNPSVMIVVYKDEKLSLMLKDIVPEGPQYRPKLPAPQIKALTPNYSEADVRTSFVVQGENLPQSEPSFNNKDIVIEDVRAGPVVKLLIGMDVMPGVTRFLWEGAKAEFYIIPTYDRSPTPAINDVRTKDGNQFLEARAGQKHLLLTIYGNNLYLKKSLPVIIPDVVGIIPQVKDRSENGREISVSLEIEKKVEPGVHFLLVATEGGLSTSWLFNVLPASSEEDLSANTARFTSSLTLLEINPIKNLLPIIGGNDKNNIGKNQNQSSSSSGSTSTTTNQKNKTPEPDEEEEEEQPESEKLSPFANSDLETSWLLETSVMIGKVTKTVSEIVHRQIPKVKAALSTNSSVSFEGGSYQIIGITNAGTKLVEPTYVSNIVLKVEGPPEEPKEPIQVPPDLQSRGMEAQNIPKSPLELGFKEGALATVYKEGDRIDSPDFGTISKVGRDTIEFVPPGLMGFHYEGDMVLQFIPPLIAKEKLQEDDIEKHIVPKDFALAIPDSANFRNIFGSNLNQFSELADLYTNESDVPKDEYDLPLGYMGLSYVDTTPIYNQNNTLSGKGVLIIDTRSDNQGQPTGDVEIGGDSKSPVEFNGIIYVRGNLKIAGNVTVMGAVIVENTPIGQVEITDNAIGMLTYDEGSIRQTLLSIPFTTKPGTIMISNKPIDLTGYVQSSSGQIQQPTITSSSSGQVATTTPQPIESKAASVPEQSLVETEKNPSTESVPPSTSNSENELINLF